MGIKIHKDIMSAKQMMSEFSSHMVDFSCRPWTTVWCIMGNITSGISETVEEELCYYEILQASQDSNSDDLKKAYRRQALIWHPDKNIHRQAEATVMFAKVQAAYETLNDPQERAWYDRNREALLRSNKNSQLSGNLFAGPMDVDILFPYFKSSAYRGFDLVSEKSFYRVFSTLFLRIDMYETSCSDISASKSPLFYGPSTKDPSTESYTVYGAKFYDYWLGFVSKRAFSDKELGRSFIIPRGLDDRNRRRVVDKERKSTEESLRRALTERVRELAAHIRRRDPRWKNYLAQKEQERIEREAKRRAEEADRRAQQTAAYKAQSWCAQPTDLSESESDSDDVEIEELYCAPCKKLFKTSKQWKSHERSKKHRSRLIELGIIDETTKNENSDGSENSSFNLQNLALNQPADDCDISGISLNSQILESLNFQLSSKHSSSDDAEIINKDKLDKDDIKMISNHYAVSDNKCLEEEICSEKQQTENMCNLNEKKKHEKQQRRAKKEKNQFKCNACSLVFLTRNQLFRHIENNGHARAR